MSGVVPDMLALDRAAIVLRTPYSGDMGETRDRALRPHRSLTRPTKYDGCTLLTSEWILKNKFVVRNKNSLIAKLCRSPWVSGIQLSVAGHAQNLTDCTSLKVRGVALAVLSTVLLISCLDRQGWRCNRLFCHPRNHVADASIQRE